MSSELVDRWVFVCTRLAGLPGRRDGENAGAEVLRFADTSLNILELLDKAWNRTNPADFAELGRRLLACDAEGFTRLLALAEATLAAQEWLQTRLRDVVAAREN
jgi:hypothetical protein